MTGFPSGPGQEVVEVDRQPAGLPGAEHRPVRDHRQRGQGLEAALLLDLAPGPDKLTDERVGEEQEAILVPVVGTEAGAHVLEVERVGQGRQPAQAGVEHAADSRRRVRVNDEIADRGAVQAHLTQGRLVDLNGDTVVIDGPLDQRVAPLLLRLAQEAVDTGQEGLRVDGVEDERDVRALAQVSIVAGDGDTTNDGGAQRFAQPGAPQAELTLIPFLEPIVPAVHVVHLARDRAPLFHELAELDQLAQVLEVDVVVVARHQARERLGRGGLAGHHGGPRVLGDVDAGDGRDVNGARPAVALALSQEPAELERLGDGGRAGRRLVEPAVELLGRPRVALGQHRAGDAVLPAGGGAGEAVEAELGRERLQHGKVRGLGVRPEAFEVVGLVVGARLPPGERRALFKGRQLPGGPQVELHGHLDPRARRRQERGDRSGQVGGRRPGFLRGRVQEDEAMAAPRTDLARHADELQSGNR